MLLLSSSPRVAHALLTTSGIDFDEFIKGVAETVTIANDEQKAKWAYDLYDIDKDGDLEFHELQCCLADKNVSPPVPWTVKHLQQVFSNTAVKHNKLTKLEFCHVAKCCVTITLPAYLILDTVKEKTVIQPTERPSLQKICSMTLTLPRRIDSPRKSLMI